jgi:3'-phosphoadenosine 5'-phosphosulfate sulfotransferase (PAPS reductase)/FAD synthetase
MKLSDYDKIILSVSGGKDSQAMVEIVVSEQGISSDKIVLVYADTGAEWKESVVQCELISKRHNVPLIVSKSFRPLPEEILKRGMWPSATCRMCTANCKRSNIDKVVRKYEGNILVVTGERREESRKRSVLEESEPLSRLTTKKRNVTSYRPMLGFTEEDIFRIIRASGLPPHPAYGFGNERVSCALCVLGSENDLRVGATHNPELAKQYLKMEEDMNHRFKSKKTLKTILSQTYFEGLKNG